MKIPLLVFAGMAGMAMQGHCQGTQSLFLPTKVSYLYPQQGKTGWHLSHTRQFTYNTNGDALTVLTSDSNQVPQTLDSMVYTPDYRLLERYWLHYDPISKTFRKHEHMVNVYDNEGNPSGSLVFRWYGTWELETGSEQVRTWNASHNEETEITKTYTASTEKWTNMLKKVTKWNAQQEIDSILLYSADSAGQFRPYSREGYGGWHQFAKRIYTSYKIERYEAGTWTLESQRTVTKKDSLWEEIEDRRWGPTAGIYRHLYKDDTTYRELFKQGYGGWLSFSTFTKTPRLERRVQNDFQGDQLRKYQTDETETDDQGNVTRVMQWVRNPEGLTIKFTEVARGIVYDSRKLPLVDSALVANNVLGPYRLAEKIIYSDYINVKQTTDMETVATFQPITIYPNPTTGSLHLASTLTVTNISVYNAAGSWVCNIQPSDNRADISALPTGMYHLKLTTHDAVYAQKIVLAAH